MMMSAKNLMIVDCDCGIDDSLALILAFAFSKFWKIIAITCVFGNGDIENTCNNAGRILQLCQKLEIPVYKGIGKPIGSEPDTEYFYGPDGFANYSQQYPNNKFKLANGHAVPILIDLARKNSNLHLVALGPMTNIAVAHRLDPFFTSNLQSIHFMGGNIPGSTMHTEYNFLKDLTAANIIITESKCPLFMTPWETVVQDSVSWKYYENLISQSNDLSLCFLRKIETKGLEKFNITSILDCDVLPMASLIQPNVVQEMLKCRIFLTDYARFDGHCENFDNTGIYFKNYINVITKFNNSILNDLRKLMVLGQY